MGGQKLAKATFGQALNYMIKSYVGPGCLSLPLAFQHAGIALGMSILLSLFVVIVYNLRNLILCKRYYEHRGVQSYADVTLITLGPRWRSVVDLLINITQLGICSVYFDFVAENLNALLPNSWGVMKTEYPCMIYVYPVFIMLGLLPSVESIAPYTGVANFLILLTIFIIFILANCQIEQHGVGDKVVESKPPSSPLFFATAVYSFEGIANLLPVENALENKEHMLPLLYLSMSIVIVIYLAVGLMAYLAWPHVTEGSITAELEDRRQNMLLAMCSWMVIFAVILTFPVQLFPSLELIEQRLGLVAAPIAASTVGPVDEEGVRDALNEAFNDKDTGGGKVKSPTQKKKKSISELTKSSRTKGSLNDDDKKGLLNNMEDGEGGGGDGFNPINNQAIIGAAQGEGGGGKDDADEEEGRRRSSDLKGIASDVKILPETLTILSNNELEQQLADEKKKPDISNEQKLCRVLVVTGTGLVAAVVPNLGDLIALIGAISGSLLAIIIPAMIDLKCPRGILIDGEGEEGANDQGSNQNKKSTTSGMNKDIELVNQNRLSEDDETLRKQEELKISVQIRKHEKSLDVFLILIGIISGLWGTILAVKETVDNFE